ncbi:MAG: hypothetical protein LBK83_04880 [Treponema sp.]|jgi:hypothetical protein|nr:hypothetical protein [Treponema sp.]
MKKLPALIKMAVVLCFGLIFVACEDEPHGDMRIYIDNTSSFTISNVHWNGNVIGVNGKSKIDPSSTGQGNADVQEGDSGPLYFTREGEAVMNLRTADSITVKPFEYNPSSIRFTLTNDTKVIDAGVSWNTASLQAIRPIPKGY